MSASNHTETAFNMPVQETVALSNSEGGALGYRDD
jgi:hypothetical protein